jgi:hypothetical protein
MSDKKPTSKKESPAAASGSTHKPAKAKVSMLKTESKGQSKVESEKISALSIASHPSTEIELPEISQPELSEAVQMTQTSTLEPFPATVKVVNAKDAQIFPPASPSRKVLDVFLIDSGWNNEVAKAVRENLPVFNGYLRGQRFYVLSEEQSLSFIKKHPPLVGADPILIVLDREAAKLKNPKGYGFRLCLGHMRNSEAALSMMKWAIQLSMAANGPEMASIVKESGQRQTIQGTIELLGEGTGHLLEFAPV